MKNGEKSKVVFIGTLSNIFCMFHTNGARFNKMEMEQS